MNAHTHTHARIYTGTHECTRTHTHTCADKVLWAHAVSPTPTAPRVYTSPSGSCTQTCLFRGIYLFQAQPRGGDTCTHTYTPPPTDSVRAQARAAPPARPGPAQHPQPKAQPHVVPQAPRARPLPQPPRPAQSARGSLTSRPAIGYLSTPQHFPRTRFPIGRRRKPRGLARLRPGGAVPIGRRPCAGAGRAAARAAIGSSGARRAGRKAEVGRGAGTPRSLRRCRPRRQSQPPAPPPSWSSSPR